jgi:hypothetical protein
MLLDESVKIKVNNKNKSHYISLGYSADNNGFFIIHNKDIPIHSRVEVNCKCDYCGNIKKTPYFLYYKNISHNNKYSCSNKCGALKRLEIYGNTFNYDKISETNLKIYGVKSYIQTKEFLIKSKKTNLEKYGTENVMQSNEIKEKIKQTNLEKYGVENPFESNEIKGKIKQTNLEKYGVDHYSKTNEFKLFFSNYLKENKDFIQNQIEKTNLERYGVKSYMLTQEFKLKSLITNLEKYGSKSSSQSELFRDKYILCNDENYVKYTSNYKSIFKCDLGNTHLFEIKSDNYFSRKKYNIALCTVCNPIGDKKSIKEKELFDFIKSIYNGEITQSYREGLEIDIYLPELKLGFEFNGLYWHSEEYKDRNYHLNKTNYFKNKGIRIIHIWEDDWNYKNDIIKSQIKNLLGISNKKIFARKCYIRELKNVTDFLNTNHIQGIDRSNIKIGLFYGDELVSMMTFNKLEGRKKMKDGEWNLSRFCNKLNTNVIGGASKLLKYFIKTYNSARIISYADKDWSIGNLYHTLGFEKIDETKPDYKYIIGGIRLHKSRFRKDNLGLDNKFIVTESDAMKDIKRIYDTGKIKFELFLKRKT